MNSKTLNVSKNARLTWLWKIIMMQAFEISFFTENYSLLPSFNGNYKDSDEPLS